MKMEPLLDPPDIILISLGTGSQTRPIFYKKAVNWRVLQWVMVLFELMLYSSGELVHYELSRLFETFDVPGQYIRINPDITRYGDKAMEFDNVSVENLDLLEEIGFNTYLDHHRTIDSLAELLLENQGIAARPKELAWNF